MRARRDRAQVRRRASRAELRRLKALVAINRTIVGAVDYDDVLRLIVGETARLTGADACVLLLAPEGGPAKVAASRGLDVEKARRFSAPLDEHVDDAVRALFALGREEAFIGSPLICSGGIRGVLAAYLAVYRGPHVHRTPRPDDLYLLSALADQGAIALEHARYRRERAAVERTLRERASEIERLYDAEAAGRTWLRAIVDQAPDAVVLLDADGRVAVQSRAALAMSRAGDVGRDPFGNAISLDLHRPSGERLPPEEHPQVRALALGEPVTNVELAVRLPDGRLLPVLANAVNVRGPRGEVIGVTAAFRDISARKEIERVREEWVTLIAHDLRQPVSTIELAARLLQSSPGEPRSEHDAKLIDRICASVERLGAMIGEMLDLTLLDARRLPIAPHAMDVAALVREVVERSAGTTAGHPVSVHEAGAPSEAFADPARVEQVLNNLLSNAAKYGTPGTEIRVDVERRSDEIEVAVSNRGRGMPPEELPRLFDRYMRSRESRAEATPGIGLGLYICKGLVEAHGGRIWAESKYGEAMCFRFTLPTRAPGAEEAPRAA